MEKQSSGIGTIIGLFFMTLLWNGVSFLIFINFFRELLRGNLSAIFIVMVITVFVAAGISELLTPLILKILAFFGIWNLEETGVPAKPKTQTAIVGNIPATDKSSVQSSIIKPQDYFPPLSFWVVLIYLTVAGILVSTKQMPMVNQWFSMRNWQETPCQIISSKVSTSDVRGKSVYAVEIEYQYTYASNTYLSNQYSRVNNTSESWKQFERIAKKYPAGTTAKCYVNPANPNDAVISRDIRGTQFGIGGLAGIILLVCALVMRFGSINQWYGIKKMLNLNPAVATRFGAWIIATFGWIVFGGGLVLGDISEMESLGKPATPTAGVTIVFIIGCILILWRLIYTIRLARAGQINPPSPFSRRRVGVFWPSTRRKSQEYQESQEEIRTTSQQPAVSETSEEPESTEPDEEYPLPALQPTMWNYTAIDHEGRKINSTISATDWVNAIESVHRRGLKPISFTPPKEYKDAIKKVPHVYFTVVDKEGHRFQGELPESALEATDKLGQLRYESFTMSTSRNLDIPSDDTALDKFGKSFSKILVLPMIGASFIFMMTFIDYFRAVNLTANNTRETIGTVLDINEESGYITYSITINGKTYEREVRLNKERIKELKEGSQIPVVYSVKYPFLFKLKSKNPSNNIPNKKSMLISGLILIGSCILMFSLASYHYIYRILKAMFAKEAIPGDDVKRLLSNLLSTILFPMIFMTVSLSMSAQYKTSFLHPFQLWIILLIVVEAGLAILLYRKQPYFYD